MDRARDDLPVVGNLDLGIQSERAHDLFEQLLDRFHRLAGSGHQRRLPERFFFLRGGGGGGPSRTGLAAAGDALAADDFAEARDRVALPDAFAPGAFGPDAFPSDAFPPDAFVPDALTLDIAVRSLPAEAFEELPARPAPELSGAAASPSRAAVAAAIRAMKPPPRESVAGPGTPASAGSPFGAFIGPMRCRRI